MKTHVTFSAALAAGLLLTGCVNPDGSPNRTGSGALIGGGTGAALGALAGGGRHGAEGAIIGGAIGALTGGLIGQSMDQEERARLRAQAPQTYQRIDQGQPLGLADVKAMARAGISDDVIISQVRATHTVYHLSSADIIDLHNAGVSQRVIDFMVNTGGQSGAATTSTTVTYVAQPPPPPIVETVVVAPSPGYVWVGGEWVWNGRWVWVAGHWGYPPRPGAVWISASWSRGPRGWHCAPGHWR